MSYKRHNKQGSRPWATEGLAPNKAAQQPGNTDPTGRPRGGPWAALALGNGSQPLSFIRLVLPLLALLLLPIAVGKMLVHLAKWA